MPEHWFVKKELPRREFAASLESFQNGLICVSAFLFLWTFNPLNHYLNFYDYFLTLFSLYTWELFFGLGCIGVVYSKLFVHHYAVTPKFATSYFDMINHMCKPRQLLQVFLHGMLAVLICIIASVFVPSQYSSPVIDCPKQPGFRCLNEHWMLLIGFGKFVGILNFVTNELNQFYTLQINPLFSLLPERITKSNNSCVPIKLIQKCSRLLYYYLITYYFLGFLPNEIFARLIGLQTCQNPIISVFNLLELPYIIWSLLLVGMLIVLLHDNCWNIFNYKIPKHYRFMEISNFPEDAGMLYTANLGKNNPELVQHLAFQFLCFISCHCGSTRKQLFSLEREGVTNRCLMWNIVADETLARITQLTSNLSDHCLKNAGYFENNLRRQSQRSSKSSSSSQSSVLSDGQSPFLSVSTLRRRPIRSDATDGSNNMSYFDVSALDATTIGANTPNSTFRHGSTITVPTPKLWTRQLQKGLGYNSPMVNSLGGASMNMESSQTKPQDFRSQVNQVMEKIVSRLKHVEAISFFFKTMPDRATANLLSNHLICKWSIRCVSFIVKASYTEDDYGVVQRRLHEVLAALIDMDSILEKYNKLPMTSSSEAVLSQLRELKSLKAETKSALYRITDTFSNHLEGIQIGSDHRRKLRAFVEHRE